MRGGYGRISFTLLSELEIKKELEFDR